MTVLPLLLTTAFHSKPTSPHAGPDAAAAGQLRRHPGPASATLDAPERRLAEADPVGLKDPARTAVVLAAAGSSDPEANAAVARMAARWPARAR